MTQLFTIENDKIVITKLALTELQGDVAHSGNLAVSGTITVDTLNVKNLNTESGVSGTPTDFGNWIVNSEEDINGKGLAWTWGNGSTHLMYRSGARLWTDADFDLDAAKSYKIDNVPVLSASTLGPSIIRSNLRQLGTLSSLQVTGDTILSEFAFFNSGFGRLGLGTEEPNAALAIAENNVEIILGSSNVGVATIGTYTNDDVALVTDNTDRIVIKNNGAIIIGNESAKNANVTIHGTLTVDNVISDTRIDRFSSLEFKATRDTSTYGKGLVWTNGTNTKQLIVRSGPDRLWTTESFDIAGDQSYYINGQAVLSATTIGEHVVHSSLQKLGILTDLTVNGLSKFNDAEFKNAVFIKDADQLNISSTGLSAKSNISITAAQDEVFYGDANEISIGNKSNVRRPITLHGPVSIGVNNPDPEVDFTVKGNFSFANKKFISGTAAPTQGTYSKGDICWNENPQSDNYVGWVCVVEGAPGTWMPFGAIGRQ